MIEPRPDTLTTPTPAMRAAMAGVRVSNRDARGPRVVTHSQVSRTIR